ncbi:hypothetical protein SNEBB_004412 [Seison nebaliae]|nr:hypothetical protein SNEBB_004412 [Seison nebaliae]
MSLSVFIQSFHDESRRFVDLDKNLTVAEFKQMISNTMAIPVFGMNLFYRSNKLEDNKKVGDYNIDGEVVYLLRSEELVDHSVTYPDIPIQVNFELAEFVLQNWEKPEKETMLEGVSNILTTQTAASSEQIQLVTSVIMNEIFFWDATYIDECYKQIEQRLTTMNQLMDLLTKLEKAEDIRAEIWPNPNMPTPNINNNVEDLISHLDIKEKERRLMFNNATCAKHGEYMRKLVNLREKMRPYLAHYQDIIMADEDYSKNDEIKNPINANVNSSSHPDSIGNVSTTQGKLWTRSVRDQLYCDIFHDLAHILSHAIHDVGELKLDLIEDRPPRLLKRTPNHNLNRSRIIGLLTSRTMSQDNQHPFFLFV